MTDHSGIYPVLNREHATSQLAAWILRNEALEIDLTELLERAFWHSAQRFTEPEGLRMGCLYGDLAWDWCLNGWLRPGPADPRAHGKPGHVMYTVVDTSRILNAADMVL